MVIATSNTHPDNLYRGGLQRERFLPFIDVLKGRIDILELEAQRDYRRDRLVDMGVTIRRSAQRPPPPWMWRLQR